MKKKITVYEGGRKKAVDKKPAVKDAPPLKKKADGDKFKK